MNKLDNISKKNPFRVPENYFEEVNRKILAATVDNQTSVVKRSIYRRLRPVFVTVVSLAAVVLVTFTVIKLVQPGADNVWLTEMNIEDLPESYLDDIDILILEEKVNTPPAGNSLPEISATEIIDYLLLENIEPNEIYELL
jgi:hypothetical protein